MSGTPISQLPAAVQAVSDPDIVPIVQTNTETGAKVTVQVPLSALVALGFTPETLGAAMLAWLESLPTEPQSEVGWWNNNGAPNYS